MNKLRLVLIAFMLCSMSTAILAQGLLDLKLGKLFGWQKLTGVTRNYSGATDGIDGDRENSYLWSAEFHGGYLYVGTMRNVIGLVLAQDPPNFWPPYIPELKDLRGRIYRMKLSTGEWEPFYISGPAVPPSQYLPVWSGPDVGYRMMKTFKGCNAEPVLYVGGAGVTLGKSRLLAIDADNSDPVPIFKAPGFSIRAISEHNRQLFWASEDEDKYPKIWYSSDPLGEFNANNDIEFPDIDVPADWFPKGAEILDMVSWNRALYVFFFDHDYDNGGFWCAKLRNVEGNWTWELIVGDLDKGAKYEKGMGRPENGGATPFIFKDKMYVGTISNTMWRFLNGDIPDTNNIPPTGTQLFRFDKRDIWTRVVPPMMVSDSLEDGLNGFANPLNLYLWRFAEQNGKLYAGTFDATTVFGQTDLVEGLQLWNPAGFDLYSTYDGNTWFPESLNGFSDPYNYGARVLITNPKNGDLYLGTANPFYGCQVWRKKSFFLF